MSAPYDPRFDEAEAEVDRGNNWRFREEGMPNPLSIIATEWSTGVTKLGEAEWLNGTDRDGKRWSVLVGPAILKKRLIEGLVEEWDNEQDEFVVVDTLGRVTPGELVSIKYTGDREGAKYTYPTFQVVRKPATAQSAEPPAPSSAPEPVADDIPF